MPPYQRNIGMVFQSYAIWPHMDVFENVAYPLQVAAAAAAARRDRGAGHGRARLVGMHALARPAGDAALRRPAAAGRLRARHRAPAEAAAARRAAVQSRRQLREQMRVELQAALSARSASPTLYVTHDQAEALAMSDVAVMEEGRIVQSGAPRDVYGRPDDQVRWRLSRRRELPASAHPREQWPHGDGRVGRRSGDGAARSALRACAGDWVDVVFRPEDTVLSFTQRNGNALPGTLERISFQGGLNECHVRVGPAVVRSNLHPSVTAQRGDQVWVSLDPKRCVVFAA